MFSFRRRGFTLIELLIVVAIIAILAAIAVPNFLEAQTRAKVSRAKSDMRAIATGLESYAVDQNTYLFMNLWAHAIWQQGRSLDRQCFERLTTPIAYITSIQMLKDPFPGQKIWSDDWSTAGPTDSRDVEAAKLYYYYARNNTAGSNARWDQPNDPKPVWWFMECSGPDLTRHSFRNIMNDDIPNPKLILGMYDPTNGTVSRGSIWRSGGNAGRISDRVFQNFMVTQNK